MLLSPRPPLEVRRLSGYPYTSQVTDANAQKALKAAFDQIAVLSNRLATLEASVLHNDATVNAAGQRVANLGNPTAEQDAVTVAFLRAYVSAQLESFKGTNGVSGTIDTTATQLVTVENGLVTEIA